MCSLATRPIRLNYLLSFKFLKLQNKIIYFYELKLLQKRKLSQLQICYLFSINRKMTWWKKILQLLQIAIPIILIQLVFDRYKIHNSLLGQKSTTTTVTFFFFVSSFFFFKRHFSAPQVAPGACVPSCPPLAMPLNPLGSVICSTSIGWCGHPGARQQIELTFLLRLAYQQVSQIHSLHALNDPLSAELRLSIMHLMLSGHNVTACIFFFLWLCSMFAKL